MQEQDIKGLIAVFHEFRTRLDTLEKISLEIGDELRCRCDYRWFSLGDLLDELKNNRKAYIAEQAHDSSEEA